MPYRGDVFAPGHFYHIYNRGAGREPIFFGPANYDFLLRLMKRHMRPCGVTVIAYCLMPNHYHFLLRQETDVPLSRFVNVLFMAYVQAVNRQEDRSGTLFQGRFRHVWVDREEYLAWLCRYIHLNPVQAGLTRFPEEWPYSDCRDWLGLRSGTLKDERFISAWFPEQGGYRQFLSSAPGPSDVPDHVKRYTLG